MASLRLFSHPAVHCPPATPAAGGFRTSWHAIFLPPFCPRARPLPSWLSPAGATSKVFQLTFSKLDPFVNFPPDFCYVNITSILSFCNILFKPVPFLLKQVYFKEETSVWGEEETGCGSERATCRVPVVEMLCSWTPSVTASWLSVGEPGRQTPGLYFTHLHETRPSSQSEKFT